MYFFLKEKNVFFIISKTAYLLCRKYLPWEIRRKGSIYWFVSMRLSVIFQAYLLHFNILRVQGKNPCEDYPQGTWISVNQQNLGHLADIYMYVCIFPPRSEFWNSCACTAYPKQRTPADCLYSLLTASCLWLKWWHKTTKS